jgi:hypothetical protein
MYVTAFGTWPARQGWTKPAFYRNGHPGGSEDSPQPTLRAAHHVFHQRWVAIRSVAHKIQNEKPVLWISMGFVEPIDIFDFGADF